jgi:mRNA-degrading endonuclease RelE of RelBE toxin-antitoxin system
MHTVVETAEFQKQAKAVWSDAEREHSSTGLPPIQVQAMLFLARDGARKVRWGRAGKGKRGGVRVIYFHLTDDEVVLLVMV